MLIKVAGAEHFSVNGSVAGRDGSIWSSGPIAPAREQQIVELRQFGLAKRVAAVEHDVVLTCAGQRIGSDQRGDVVGREYSCPPNLNDSADQISVGSGTTLAIHELLPGSPKENQVATFHVLIRDGVVVFDRSSPRK